MKTNTISPKKTSLYSFIGFLSILLSSCGSYQNSSYYDSDGIYGNTDTRTIVRTTERVVETNPNTPYKEYFNSLQNNNQPTEIFTDVDSYGNYDTINDSIQVTNSGYSGWGSNPQDVNITIYDSGWNNWYSPNWYGSNWGFGFGFNNWYGAWGYPYYGWGYTNYGWGYTNYGYTNNYYTYNPGRRGSSYSNRVNTNRNYSSRNYSQNQINNVSRNNNSTNFRRNSSNILNRTAPTFTRGTQSQTRNNTTNPVRTRVNTSTNNTRSESYTPSRSNNSNNSYSPSRSSGNSGGGRSSGGSGGRSRG